MTIPNEPAPICLRIRYFPAMIHSILVSTMLAIVVMQKGMQKGVGNLMCISKLNTACQCYSRNPFSRD